MKFINNLKFKSGTIYIIVPFFLFIGSTYSFEEIKGKAIPQSGNCTPFQEYLDLIAHPPESKPENLEVIQYNIELREKLKISAENIWSLYISGKYTLGSIESCIKNEEDLSIFYQKISDVFLEKSLQFLETLKTPTHLSLTQNIRKTQIEKGMLIYRLLSHGQTEEEEAQKEEGKQGGYHRGKRSLFMNFEKIPSSDWWIIFIHEISHAQDSILQLASEEYSNESLSMEVAKICNSHSQLELLSKSEREKIENYFCSGFHRGLLAEVRAWTFTFRAYLEGVESGVYSTIEWMDLLIKATDFKLSDPQNLQELKVFTFLSPRFNDPTDGFYSLELSKELLKNIREEYLKGHKSAFEFR